MTATRSKIIGISGGIGSGKSTASAYLREKGWPVIDADIIARDLSQPGQVVYQEILRVFGADIMNEDSSLDRGKLGDIVFSNPAQLKLLNQISHPAIYDQIKKEIKDQEGKKIIFLDVALLIEEAQAIREAGISLDQSWLIYTDYESQIERIISRNNLTREEAEKRINSQMPLEEKKEKADIIIDNRGTVAELQEQLDYQLKILIEDLKEEKE